MRLKISLHGLVIVSLLVATSCASDKGVSCSDMAKNAVGVLAAEMSATDSMIAFMSDSEKYDRFGGAELARKCKQGTISAEEKRCIAAAGDMAALASCTSLLGDQDSEPTGDTPGPKAGGPPKLECPAGTKPVDTRDKRGDTERACTDEQGVKNGPAQVFSMVSSTLLNADGSYRDGKRHGVWRTYRFPSGKTETETNYAAGIKSGAHKEFHVNGKLKFEGQHQDGKKHGVWVRWHDNGQKHDEGEYKLGKPKGEWNSWHDNGQKDRTVTYTGKDTRTFEGLFQRWHENGQKSDERHMKNGQPVGEWTSWHENGQRSLSEKYKDGKRHGSRLTWHENGKPARKSAYVNGKLHGKVSDWYPDGSNKSQESYKNGKQHGAAARWHENGKRESQGSYNDGQPTGKHLRWHDDGKKSAEVVYSSKGSRQTDWYENGKMMSSVTRDQDGKKAGKETEWHENGNRSSEGEYQNGKKQGTWTYWHENGKKSSEGTYKDDAQEGKWTEWYDNGQKEEEGSYKDDQKWGEWQLWHENGQQSEVRRYTEEDMVQVKTWDENGKLTFAIDTQQ